jgi:hypothetical protein
MCVTGYHAVLQLDYAIFIVLLCTSVTAPTHFLLVLFWYCPIAFFLGVVTSIIH